MRTACQMRPAWCRAPSRCRCEPGPDGLRTAGVGSAGFRPRAEGLGRTPPNCRAGWPVDRRHGSVVLAVLGLILSLTVEVPARRGGPGPGSRRRERRLGGVGPGLVVALGGGLVVVAVLGSPGRRP